MALSKVKCFYCLQEKQDIEVMIIFKFVESVALHHRIIYTVSIASKYTQSENIFVFN